MRTWLAVLCRTTERPSIPYTELQCSELSYRLTLTYETSERRSLASTSTRTTLNNRNRVSSETRFLNEPGGYPPWQTGRRLLAAEDFCPPVRKRLALHLDETDRLPFQPFHKAVGQSGPDIVCVRRVYAFYRPVWDRQPPPVLGRARTQPQPHSPLVVPAHRISESD